MRTDEGFFGPYRFLSNFYPAFAEYEGVFYATSEAAFQAAKFTDPEIRRQFQLCDTPGKAKRLGRNLSPIRPDWDEIRISVMRDILESKFKDPHLRDLLYYTRDLELVEINNWGDCFWGVCNGVGENHLGLLLMELREKIRNEYLQG